MGVAIPQVVSEDRAGGAQIVDGGLRFDGAKSQYLSRTPGSAGNRRTATWSGWVKLGNHSSSGEYYLLCTNGTTDSTFFYIEIRNNQLRFGQYNSGTFALYSTQLFRDPSAWYHIVVAVDTTQATASNRAKAYVNGTEITSWSTANYPAQNNDLGINDTRAHAIGSGYSSGSPYAYWDGYVTAINFIDGQALDASYFGYTDPLTNVWRPKKFKPQATPNNGTVWSSTSTIPTNPANAFDGDISTYATISNSNGTRTVTTGTFTIKSTLEVYIQAGSGYVYTFTINGTPYTLNTGTVGWNVIPGIPANTTVTSFTVAFGPSSGDYINGFRVDGVTLLDGDTTNIGLNGFHLPLDGSAPIGQDQSGRGNNWTPVNFGGSNTIEKATGALPILNTDGGGKVARVGVRTDANASSLVLALPLVGIKSDFSNAVNSGTSNKTVTNTNSASFSSSVGNFYGGSVLTSSSSNSSLDIPSSTDFQFGSGDFTVEFWVNPVNTTTQNIMGYGNSGGGTGFAIYKTSSQFAGQFAMSDGTKTFTGGSYTTGNWYHLAFVRSGSALTLYVNGVNSASSTTSGSMTTGTDGFAVGKYGLYGGSGDAYFQDVRVYKGLAKYTSNFIPASTDPDIVPDSPSGVSYSSNVALVPSTDGGAVSFNGSTDWLTLAYNSDYDFTGQFTLEAFVYPSVSTGDHSVFGNFTTSATGYWGLGFDYSTYGVFTTFYYQGNTNVTNTGYVPIPRAWNHYAVTRDASNVIRVFLNGQLLPTTATYSGTLGVTSQNSFIGFRSGLNPLNGLISNVHWVKGTCLYTTNFTPPTGPISSVANTKLLCCKSQTSATAADVAPGSISVAGGAAASNFNPFTANINTQRGKQSGYPTLNPLAKGANVVLSSGNLYATGTSTADFDSVFATVPIPSSGKWYFEFDVTAHTAGYTAPVIGVATLISQLTINYFPGGNTNEFGWGADGSSWLNGSQTDRSLPSVAGDIMQLAVDTTNGNIWAGRNNIWAAGGNPATNTSPLVSSSTFARELYFAVSTYQQQGAGYINFGQKPFKFPPPAGFQPLTLANTPRPTIVRPDQYVGISTWTGNDVNNRKIVTNFKPDLFWVKSRTSNAYHSINDSVRGPNAILQSNTTTGEQVNSNGYVTAFVSDGVTITNGSDINSSSYGSYVGWAWKAGGSGGGLSFWKDDVGYATASAAGLTAGTITPSGASVGTKQGFSIIAYTGNGSSSSGVTISHGLGKTPDFIITKKRSSGTDYGWSCWHKDLGGNYGIWLDKTSARNISMWSGYTNISSTVFSPPDLLYGNESSQTYINYLWAEIPGFSKFGFYTGNGDANGPVVITGFKPRWIMIKRTDSTAEWFIFDTARDTFNVSYKWLKPNNDGTEPTTAGDNWDLLSNGFKPRNLNGNQNASGGTYIYAAFAETPTFNLYGGQANAR